MFEIESSWYIDKKHLRNNLDNMYSDHHIFMATLNPEFILLLVLVPLAAI